MNTTKNDTQLSDDYEKVVLENAYLKQMIHHLLPTVQLRPPEEIVTNASEPAEKIRLFKELFIGRTDVFARRWASSDGKVGYSPVESNGKYVPLTNQVIYDHLRGEHVIGVYPMLSGDTCRFFVVDFDKGDWQKDVSAFVAICNEVFLPCYIEKSRSGNGAHVWMFFAEALPAVLARKLGNALLKKTQTRTSTSLSSFDRFFPSQDHLSASEGLGNLIALPLQQHARIQGNSEFVTSTFDPIDDQWAYLCSVIKIDENLVRNALYALGAPAPELFVNEQHATITAVRKNGIHFALDHLSEAMLNQLKSLATFGNPEYHKAKAKRLSTQHLSARIECFDVTEKHLILPRGTERAIRDWIASTDYSIVWQDERYAGTLFETEFMGQLTTQQQDAMDQFMKNECGVLAATTGFGKTVTAAALIAERKVNTLIIVNRKQLQSQWIEQLATFLSIPKKAIGQIGGGKQTGTGMLDVATVQTLTANGISPLITQYGQVIIDECHHVSAYTNEQLLKMVCAKYVYGLTATPSRKDGLHPIIHMQCGPIVYKSHAKTQALIRPFHHVLKERFTSYQTTSSTLPSIYNELAENERRNQLIFNDVLLALEDGFTPLILTERVSHVETLANMFKGFAKNVVMLSGNLSKKKQAETLQTINELPPQEELVIIATGKYIGEGFDCARLSALFLTMPFASSEMLTQYVGRLHRQHDEKQEVRVYDYIDRKVPVLLNMSHKRMKGYKQLGYIREADQSSTAEQLQLF
ncbi:TOTE conflict system archaeo-eukaryotic primase domain-containing protein [Sporosarcina sp. ITBMC105]